MHSILLIISKGRTVPWRMALEGVTESTLVNRQVMLKIGDKSYPIIFPGLQSSKEQYIKFWVDGGPTSLMLCIVYDNDHPLDLEYVLFEETGRGTGKNTATS